MTEHAWMVWMLRTALGGGLVLLFGWLGQRWLTQPIHRQRLGEWSVAAALLVALVALFPAWWCVPVPAAAPPVPDSLASSLPPQEEAPEEFVVDALPPLAESSQVEAPLAPTSAPEPARWTWQTWLLVGYVSMAALTLGYWLLAHLIVVAVIQRRQPAPPWLSALATEVGYPDRVRLMVCDRVEVPFSFGFWRPVVVLPTALVEEASYTELRWVLAHELSHLQRQDTRSCWLFVLGQVVYFYIPWLWWLRRRVRLAQEYLADAAAVQWAGCPADYAQFLVSWARGRTEGGCRGAWWTPSPAAVTGVTGSGSDLFRRVTMLLESKNPLSARCSRLWGRTLAGVLVALGLVAGGVGLRVVAAEDNKKDEPAREAPGKEAPPKEAPKDPAPRKRVPIPVPVDPERLLENFGGLGLDEDAARELRQRMDEVRRQMEEMRKQMQQQGFRGGLGGGFGGGFGGLGGGMALPGDPFGPLTTAKPRQPRLGAQVRVPNQTLVDQLELPRDQGLVLEEVGPNTAAGKAGLKSHDILLELDGKPVPSKVDEFLKQLEGVQANKPVDVVVLRKGKKETVKGLNLPEVKAEERPAANQPRAGRLSAPLLGGNNRNAMTTFNRTNDDFTVRHRDNGLSIQLRGAINQGNAQVTEIVIDEDGKKTTYTSVDKVPAEYRAKVQKLAEMSAKGNIRVPFE